MGELTFENHLINTLCEKVSQGLGARGRILDQARHARLGLRQQRAPLLQQLSELSDQLPVRTLQCPITSPFPAHVTPLLSLE